MVIQSGKGSPSSAHVDDSALSKGTRAPPIALVLGIIRQVYREVFVWGP